MARAAPAARVTPVRVILLAFVVYAYFMPRWADWNIDSRIALVHALVDQHSVRIDKYNWITWDKAVYKGHFYSDKAPGTAVLGAVVYAGFVALRSAPITGTAIHALEQNAAWNVPIKLGKTATQFQPAAKGRRLGGCQRTGLAGNVQYIPWGNRLVPPKRDWALSKYVVTVGVVGLISALFAGFLFWFLGMFLTSIWIRLLAVSLYAFVTDALPYSTNFYSHQLAAVFLFVAFALLYLRGRDRVGARAVGFAGFLLGFAFFTEYTVLPVAAAIGLYGLWQIRRTPAESFPLVVAGLIPLAGLFVYNYACFGNPLDTGYSHDFCWSSAQAGGFAGFTTPKPGPLFDLTFGTFRGLFYMSPFLLLAAPGAAIMVRRGLALEATLNLGIGILFIVLLSAYWGWNGGQVDGPRYLVPIIPFLAFPVAFVLGAARKNVGAWFMVCILSLWAIGAVWIEFLGGLLFPMSWLRDPIPEYSWPNLTGNHIAPNAGYFLGLRGWESLLPLLLCVLAWSAWVAIGPAPYSSERRFVERAARPVDI